MLSRVSIKIDCIFCYSCSHYFLLGCKYISTQNVLFCFKSILWIIAIGKS
uniref:Uncharacterized protein n=1 Tax=uncultured marine virus TaxID=186617 RepID=A0A0F7LBG1_9VIRU|nr:hypothetical protein [uncultured marine virus]